MVCFPADLSPSGIVCCHDGDDNCEVTEDKPAICVEYTFPCTKEQGGGCCPQGTKCSPQGCTDVYIAAPDLPLPSPPGTSTLTATTMPATPAMPTPGITAAPTDIATTATKFPDAVTVTTIKFGEVAVRSRGAGILQPGFGLSCWSATALEGVVLVFALVFMIL